MFFMDPFFWDLFVNGLLIGSMYALVALGFVLIYKATSVINFAQGDLVMFGGYIAAAGLSPYPPPLWGGGTRRPLIGQPAVSVVMVTIGLALVFQGLAAMIWGAATINLPLPIPLKPF